MRLRSARGACAGNVIPDRCVIEVNYRFAPSRSADEAVGVVREFFADADTARSSTSPPACAWPGRAARAGLRCGGRCRAHSQNNQLTSAQFSPLGIPAVNFGPGNALLAHADDERGVPVAQIEESAAALRAWLAGLCSRPAAAKKFPRIPVQPDVTVCPRDRLGRSHSDKMDSNHQTMRGGVMAAMKPRTGDGPMEAVRESRLIVVRVPLEGGGRLVVSVNDQEAAELRDVLAGVLDG